MSERFDLSGGALCLDFANTWEDRERPETEKLRGYDALLAFARQTGLMSEGARERLAARAREDRAGPATVPADRRCWECGGAGSTAWERPRTQ
jgi:hypothetical protein